MWCIKIEVEIKMLKNRISNQWMKLETCNFVSFLFFHFFSIFKWLEQKLNCSKLKLEFNSSNKSFHFIRFFYLSAPRKLFPFHLRFFILYLNPPFVYKWNSTIHESFINIVGHWKNVLFPIRLHVFRDRRQRRWAELCFSLCCNRGRERRQLYNYVSVYEFHFHYVTINMLLRFL